MTASCSPYPSSAKDDAESSQSPIVSNKLLAGCYGRSRTSKLRKDEHKLASLRTAERRLLH